MATVSGLDKASKRLRRLAANLDKIDSEIRRDLRDTRINIQAKAPVRTGYMRDHIVDREITHGAEVHSQAHYTGFVEFGTRFIAARNFFRPDMYDSIARLVKSIGRLIKS